ncbi:thiamine-phosphate kinase [Bacteroidota bacterium]
MLNKIKENQLINNLIKNFNRTYLQINEAHCSDAELLQIPTGKNSILAVTTDSISEEINVGLYKDLYLAGWMIVMVNLSDLAAVGAEPLGIVISEIFPPDLNELFKTKLQKGISDACNECNTYVLGGDTNFGNQLILNGTALGIIEGSKIISRIGCQQNDILYASGKIGNGNAFALSKLLYPSELNYQFKPKARIKEGKIIREYASACMDTSDGVIAALDQLLRLNNIGFELDDNWKTAIEVNAKQLFDKLELALWLLLAGQHGEFELIFTIPESNEKEFLSTANAIDWKPIKIGNVIEEAEIKLPIYNKIVTIDGERIRNLNNQTSFNVSEYLKSLLEMDKQIRENT